MMVVPAMMAALLISGASPEAEAMAARYQDLLLAGGNLPRGFRAELAVLAPVDRYALVIWLRRSGLFGGAEIPIDEMLAPPAAPGAAR